MRIIVSACLLGVNCRYHQRHNFNPYIVALLNKHELIPVCPEQLGGLPRPMPATEIRGGNGYRVLDYKAEVVDKEGNDYSAQFIRGAEEVLRLASLMGCASAIMKERSPSCGVRLGFSGTFGGLLVPSIGVTSAYLQRYGMKVSSEDDYKDFL